MMTIPEEILAFWFGREGEEGYGEFREAWFLKDPDFDREIRDRFEAVYERPLHESSKLGKRRLEAA